MNCLISETSEGMMAVGVQVDGIELSGFGVGFVSDRRSSSLEASAKLSGVDEIRLCMHGPSSQSMR